MNADLIVKIYKIHPLREAIMLGVLIFIISFLSSYFILHHSLKAEKEEIKEGMLRQVKIMATLIDGDVHPEIAHEGTETTMAYKTAIKPLSRALLETCDIKLDRFEQILNPEHGCSITFIYTVIQKAGKVYYVLDPWPAGIPSPNNPKVEMKSYIMDHYGEANDDLLQAFRDKSATTTDIYKDAWGEYFSAYAPFYNSADEFVGIVGVDMKAERYLERLKPIKVAATRAFVATFFIAYLVASIIWFLRNFTLIINTKRIDLKQRYEKLVCETKSSSLGQRDKDDI